MNALKIHPYSHAARIVRRFWTAREEYDFYSTRCPLGIKEAQQKMNDAVGELMKMGYFKSGGKHMPTLDELEKNINEKNPDDEVKAAAQ